MKAFEKLNLFKKPQKLEKSPEVFARQEWFEAYYQANAMVPQAEMGIGLLLIARLLEDPNVNWEELAVSKLSPKQIDVLGRGMSAMHKHRNIKISTAEMAPAFHPEIPKKIITQERLQQIWQEAVQIVFVFLLNYIDPSRTFETDKDGFIVISDKVGAAKEVEEYLSSRNNVFHVLQLRQVFHILKKTFERPDVKEMLAEYRDQFSDPEKVRTRNLWKRNYMMKLSLAFTLDLRTMFPKGIPEEVMSMVAMGSDPSSDSDFSFT